LDTEGAQIRTGWMLDGRVDLKVGQSLLLVPEEAVGTAERLTLYPPESLSLLKPGMVLRVDFDACTMVIKEKLENGCRAEVVNAGQVGSNKGVAADEDFRLAPLTEKDRQAIAIARGLGIHLYSYSFCSDAAAVRLLRDQVGGDSTIISKIESRLALLHLDEIIEESDALLVDRGDLARSISLEEIPALQKFILRRALQRPIPVYVATNLLESMVERPYPTRAEINDIANTLLDGANGLVLAAETAIGKHPVECVRMIVRMVRRYHDQADVTGWTAGEPGVPAVLKQGEAARHESA
jgi:pyruvate kinase